MSLLLVDIDAGEYIVEVFMCVLPEDFVTHLDE
jgi:hypothetical protein